MPRVQSFVTEISRQAKTTCLSVLFVNRCQSVNGSYFVLERALEHLVEEFEVLISCLCLVVVNVTQAQNKSYWVFYVRSIETCPIAFAMVSRVRRRQGFTVIVALISHFAMAKRELQGAADVKKGDFLKASLCKQPLHS